MRLLTIDEVNAVSGAHKSKFSYEFKFKFSTSTKAGKHGPSTKTKHECKIKIKGHHGDFELPEGLPLHCGIELL